MRFPAILPRRSLRAALTAGTLACVLAGATVPAASADGTAPPWAPGGVSPDSFAKGGLTFYNSSGSVITSGSTNTAPFAAYVQGRVVPRPVETDTKATLFFYVPQEGSTPDTWSHDEVLGLGTTYPAAAAPSPLNSSTLPVYTGGSSDASLESAASDFPPTSTTTGYQNVYEIRLYTTHPNGPPASYYDYADITIDTTSHTWTLVFTPGSATTPADASALTIKAPKSVRYGASAKITTKLTDTVTHAAIASAPVKLYGRANPAKTWKLVKAATTTAAGAASASVKLTANEQFQWRYAATSAHKAATSKTASVTATAVVSAARTPAKIKHGKSVTVYGTISRGATGVTAQLQQQVKGKWKTVATTKTRKQTLPTGRKVGFLFSQKLATKGTYHLRVATPATSSLGAGTSPALSVTVT